MSDRTDPYPADGRAGASPQRPEEVGVGRLFWLTSEAIVAADLETQRIILWNTAAEELFGYPEDEAVGMRLERLVPEELRSQHLEGLHRYLESGESRLVGRGAIHVHALTHDGSHRDIALSLTDVTEASGPRVVLALIRDITEQKRTETELLRANDAMHRFVATASHDLRAPLSTVHGFAQLLNGEVAVPDETRDRALRAILRGAEQAIRLVDDLMTLSQIEAGAVGGTLETVNVANAVDDAIAMTGVGVAAACPADLHVRVDPLHLERILVNYLTNAERYGTPPIDVAVESDDDSVRISVRDAGPGIPDEFLDLLFTPFARASNTLPIGTGLGLSIVSGLASANDGTVFYDRSDDRTSFGVELPRA